jgi:fucose permease
MAAACLVCTGLAFFSALPSMRESEGLRWSSLKGAVRGDRGLLLGAVLLNALYIGGETSVMGWVVYYLQKVFAGDISVFRASRVLTYFWMFMIIGRILTALVVERAGSFLTLFVLVSGGLATWAGAMLSGNLVLSEVLFALTGLFFSGQFPLIASYAGRFPERYTGLAFSLILAGGGLGGALFPFLVGWLADRRGLQAGLASALSSLVLMLLLLWFLRRRGADVWTLSISGRVAAGKVPSIAISFPAEGSDPIRNSLVFRAADAGKKPFTGSGGGKPSEKDFSELFHAVERSPQSAW